MKKLVLFLGLFAFATSVFAQDSISPVTTTTTNSERRAAPSGGFYSKDEAAMKVVHFTQVKKKGVRRSIIGGSLTTLGIILMSSADWTTQSTSTSASASTKDPQGGFGMFMTLAGVPITTVGLIQLGVGSAKIKEYQSLFATTNLYIAPLHDGVHVAIRSTF